MDSACTCMCAYIDCQSVCNRIQNNLFDEATQLIVKVKSVFKPSGPLGDCWPTFFCKSEMPKWKGHVSLQIPDYTKVALHQISRLCPGEGWVLVDLTDTFHRQGQFWGLFQLTIYTVWTENLKLDTSFDFLLMRNSARLRKLFYGPLCVLNPK